MDQVLKAAVTTLGGESNNVELSKLRADVTVTGYFQRTLIKPLWPEETFVVYFQSRPDEWDFDQRTRGVRIHSALGDQIKEMMLTKRKKAPLPEKLYEALLRAGTMPETIAAISNAGAADVAALPIDTVEALLTSFGKPLDAAVAIVVPVDIFVASQIKVIAAVPGSLDKKGAGLPMIMDFYKRILEFGGEALDLRVAHQRIETIKELCNSAATQIREKGLGTVSPKLLGLLCQTAPIHINALAISGLGEKGEGDDVKACAGLLSSVPAAVLEGLPQDTLLRLAAAAGKSAAVAEAVLGIVAAASAATLPAWNLEDTAKLLLSLAKVKAGGDGAPVVNLYGRAAETLFGKLPSLSDSQLIKVTLAFSKVTSCKEFLEAVAEEAVKRISNIPLPQLLFLTQGLSTLGGGNASFVKILDCWASSPDDAKPALTADQLAKLTQVAAPIAPGHADFWIKIGAQLVAQKGSLTDAGKASVEAAFPDGGGPTFGDKDKLLAAVKPPPKSVPKDSKDTDKDRGKDKDRRDDRGRDDRGRDRRSRDRDDRRDDRGRDRDRGRRSRSRRR